MTPYESRLTSVSVARQISTKLTFADQGRSRIRALTKGMLDGNPPYSEAERRRYGLKWTANLNFMEAEASVDSARTPYYDLITGAKTLTDCCTRYNQQDPEWTNWNEKITKHFDWLLKSWNDFYFHTWNEQFWMLVEGFSLNLFDESGWKWRSLAPSCVKVPQRSQACLNDKLPYVIVKLTYSLTEIWEMIKDEEAAGKLGYNVELMKQAIQRSDNTMGPNNTNWRDQPWEEWQRRLRANDIESGVSGEDVTICHLYLREFAEKSKKTISHFMFTENALNTNDLTGPQVPDEFLRKQIRKYESYQEALCVTFQNTADGYWHSVRGMAQKGFRHWDVSNRLKCKSVDNAFLRSMLILDPVDITDFDKLQLTVKSDVAVLPPGTKVQQLQHAGDIEGALAVDRMITNHLANNLGVYNQRTLTREDGRGEQPTATQVEMQASKEAQLSNGQIGLYYLGRDSLYSEAFKKAVSSSDSDAMEFKRRCEEDGVPPEALKDMEYVRCNRQAGYGSTQMKRVNLGAIGNVVGMLPEEGKNNFLDDLISAYAGTEKVERYNPKLQLPTSDDAWATLENGLMHQGEEPVVVSGQDAVNHLQIHFEDAKETLGPLEQGVEMDQPDPDGMQAAMPYVRAFVPHVEKHIAILSQDQSRKELAKYFSLQLKAVLSFSNKMFGVLRDVQRQNQLAAMEQQQATALTALDQAKIQSQYQKMALQRDKAIHTQEVQDMKFLKSEKRADAKTITEIQRDQAKTKSDILNQSIKTLTNGATQERS